MMLGMAKRHERSRDSPLCYEFASSSRENEKRFAAGLFLDVDVAPTHRLADTGAECLRDSFFGRKTRSKMARWKFHRHRIFNLAVGKNAVEKTIAKSIDGPLNTRALDQIDTSTDNAHLEL